MSSIEPPSDEALRLVLAADEAVWEAGCPVAGGSEIQWTEVARRAIRRWRSGSRRHVSQDGRIDDLATGLIAAFEPNLRLVGPLVRDYEYLAARIAAALEGP